MIIEAKKYNGICVCGREHGMTTEFCVIEEDCLKDFNHYLSRAGLHGFCTAIYDQNTYRAVGTARPRANREIIMNPENLHANEHAVDQVLTQLSADNAFLIAVGSGTVHDIVRYCAFTRNIPFVSCPTAASVDGFCSSVAAMTWEGCKKTLTAVAPKFVLADLSIIAKAPMRLTRSGFGDMIGKLIAHAEWKIAALLTDEYYCKQISDMMLNATNAVLDSSEAISQGKTSAFKQLTYGLIMSGLAMQLMGNSRPASGAEHHISHLIETAPKELGIYSDALHGEKVGVATILVSEEYHRLAADKAPIWNDYPEVRREELRQLFEVSFAAQLAEENTPDVAKGITKEMIEKNWDGICKIISEIPAPEKLLRLYEKIGAKANLSQIGVPEDKKQLLLKLSPLVRNRLTLMRLRRAISN